MIRCPHSNEQSPLWQERTGLLKV